MTLYNLFTGSQTHRLIILNTQSIAKHTCKENYELSTKSCFITFILEIQEHLKAKKRLNSEQ